MPYTYKALALVWLAVCGLFALSGSGEVVGPGVLLLVGAAFMMPALILTICAKPRPAVVAIAISPERPVVVPAVRGDASGVDLYRWENEGGARRPA